MIIEKKFLDKLKQFGLNSYEAKIWAALLSRGVSTAGELSDISNVPRSRSYDVLESLEKKGFIIMKIGKPIKYIAVEPSEVVERVKKDTLTNAKKQAEVLDEVKETEMFKQLSALHSNGLEMVDPSDMSGNLKSRDHVYSQMDSMIKSAEESVDIITTSEGLNRKAKALKKAFKKANKRGVSIRILAPVNNDTERSIDDISEFVEVRNIEKIKARTCIVDKKEIAFMIMDDKKVDPSFDGGIWLNTEFFANALSQMFEEAWKKAEVTVKN
ncbi:MAG: TrmB family transcriptional regulator [Nanobdellota archaeon]